VCVFPTLVVIMLIEKSSTITKDQSKTKRLRTRIAAVSAVIVLGGAVAGIFKLKSRYSDPDFTWQRISWRMGLFARKAKGGIPGLSWRELWFMTHVRGGFSLEGFVNGDYSLDGALRNPYITAADHRSGAAIFREHCVRCHGDNGTGGAAPPLDHPGLSHGDSDFAKYVITRDGIPHTAMAPVPMSAMERWQLVGYLRTLQSAAASPSTERLPPINIQVTGEQIRNSGSSPDEWLTYSGSLNGWRYTPLAEINRENVSRLRVRWIRQFPTSGIKSESTPIVVGGEIFITEPPCEVVALDANSGNVRWRYKRALPDKLPIDTSATNRGLAALGNMLYLGSLDDFLVAINADNGGVIWQTRVAKPSDGFTMTGATLLVNGLVVVGVSGGEFGIRGFLAAYDAKTGQPRWKFNTIPGPGEFGHNTWQNDAWRTGGGPTWITGSYDPALDLLYWGVGNPAPGLNGDVRPGDNLFTDSIVALHASSGKLAWYFQFTPHDEHDWDATQTPILVDIPVHGVLRRLLCVANRNGFYYVLDRTSGKFLLGVPFVQQNWAKGLDPTGRPILASGGEFSPSGRLVRPGVSGGVNWQNAAFDKKRGLIFIPATEGASVFTKSPHPSRGYLGFYVGSSGGDDNPDQFPKPVVRALDVTTGARKWEYFSPQEPFPSDSGLLATGGGLVFGASGGYIFALDSATGRELWRVLLGGVTSAPPISFTVDGHQVILVSAGHALFMFGL
jgi:alcohol dehydrogenase (cytochrome c)